MLASATGGRGVCGSSRSRHDQRKPAGVPEIGHRFKTVIRRDHTFEYQGETWLCQRGGPDGPRRNWSIVRKSDGLEVDDFDTLGDIRSFVDKARENDWPLAESEHLFIAQQEGDASS